MEEDAAARQALLATIQAFVGRHQTATDGEEDRLSVRGPSVQLGQFD